MAIDRLTGLQVLGQLLSLLPGSSLDLLAPGWHAKLSFRDAG